MYSKTYSCSAWGIESILTTIELDYRSGLGYFNIAGFSSRANNEAKDRITAALRNSGFDYHPRKLTVNVLPSDKVSSWNGYDLAIAVAYLKATGQIKADISRSVFVGELSLAGGVEMVNGLDVVLSGGWQTIDQVFVPAGCRLTDNITSSTRVYAVKTLKQLVKHLQTPMLSPLRFRNKVALAPELNVNTFANFDQNTFQAAIISAVGKHNMLIFGSPGTGKTMLATTLPQLAAPLTVSAQREINKIYSVVNLPAPDGIPVRQPHHSITVAGMIGGGTTPLPGEITLAHNGFLILDELLEYRTQVLDALREPLTEGQIRLSRAQQRLHYPARLQLLATTNLCRCGNYGHPSLACICTETHRKQYLQRISGPLISRFDILLPLFHVKQLGISLTVKANELHDYLSEVYKFKAAAASVEGLELLSSAPASVQRQVGALQRELMWAPRQQVQLLRLAKTCADLRFSHKISTDDIYQAFNLMRVKLV